MGIVLWWLMLGCFGGTAPEEVVPGHWASWVNQDIEGLIDVNTELHMQLWKEGGDLEGWLYHTDGDWQVQDQYITAPCDPEWITGTYREEDWGYHINCMRVGNKCISAQVRQDRIEIDLGDLSYGLLGWITLESSSPPTELGREEFNCQK